MFSLPPVIESANLARRIGVVLGSVLVTAYFCCLVLGRAFLQVGSAFCSASWWGASSPLEGATWDVQWGRCRSGVSSGVGVIQWRLIARRLRLRLCSARTRRSG